MGLYEVPLSVSFLGFGIGTMLSNYNTLRERHVFVILCFLVYKLEFA